LPSPHDSTDALPLGPGQIGLTRHSGDGG